MSCTTVLIGKKASNDGSVMIARNDDSPSGKYEPKKFLVVNPSEQPKKYRSVLSHFEIRLPADPLHYTAVPNVSSKEGIWAASGINEANVAMTATETIGNNERVLGADPLVEYREATEKTKEMIGGISEEDMVTLVLPYIRSAREGVLRLGKLIEELGTSEMNGIGFADREECWWFESVGGHHWIARRVDDNAVVIMPNQLGIDDFDLADALGKKKAHLCSADLLSFILDNHLDLFVGDTLTRDVKKRHTFNPRDAFGTREDADHVYNTPRAWFMLRYLSGDPSLFDGPDADYLPEDDDLPWQVTPARRVTTEDVKYLLSSHFQGTPYDPYGSYGDGSRRGMYRSIGVNRTDFYSCLQLRNDVDERFCALQWIAFGSNVFNAAVPFYTNVTCTPDYLSCTRETVSTDSLYWTSRLIAAMADASYGASINNIERHFTSVTSKAHALIREADGDLQKTVTGRDQNADRKVRKLAEEANEKMSEMLREETDRLLGKVLYARSNEMKNGYARSDH